MSVRWEIFEACPVCGAREGKPCIGYNGGAKRKLPCPARNYTTDGAREVIQGLHGRMDGYEAELRKLRESMLKIAKGVDLLLGELE